MGFIIILQKLSTEFKNLECCSAGQRRTAATLVASRPSECISPGGSLPKNESELSKLRQKTISVESDGPMSIWNFVKTGIIVNFKLCPVLLYGECTESGLCMILLTQN